MGMPLMPRTDSCARLPSLLLYTCRSSEPLYHKMFDNKIFKQESFQSRNYNNCKLCPLPAKAHMFYLDILSVRKKSLILSDIGLSSPILLSIILQDLFKFKVQEEIQRKCSFQMVSFNCSELKKI